MKRYLLFSYEPHVAIKGGWNDFVGSFDTIEEVKAAAPERGDCHIVDLEFGAIIETSAHGFQRVVTYDMRPAPRTWSKV